MHIWEGYEDHHFDTPNIDVAHPTFELGEEDATVNGGNVLLSGGRFYI